MLHKDLLAKRFFILLTLLWMVLSQCGASIPSKKPKQWKKIASHNMFDTPFPENTSYFPKNTFSKYVTNWYSEVLKRMNEPILYTLIDKNIETYRFTLIPSFYPALSIRVYQSGEKKVLIVKELSEAGGYDLGELKHNVERQLLKKEWQNILVHVKRSSYWFLKTKIDDLGFDGEEWIMEGVKSGKYHVVDRWSLDEGSYRDFCDYLLKLSRVD
ncbi:MAG TPA: hypothetical protein ENI73_08090 [Spirochaetes bacterium]|nr:hypothetical protein [Spirochaetota bacterium]